MVFSKTIKKALCLSVLAWFGSAAVARTTASLPPVGKRAYEVNTNDPYKPVNIADEKAGVGAVLKDPTLKVKVGASMSKPALAAPKKPLPKARAAQLSFGSMPIKGRISKPRVAFEREDLPVDLVDEPVDADFLQQTLSTSDSLEVRGF